MLKNLSNAVKVIEKQEFNPESNARVTERKKVLNEKQDEDNNAQEKTHFYAGPKDQVVEKQIQNEQDQKTKNRD